MLDVFCCNYVIQKNFNHTGISQLMANPTASLLLGPGVDHNLVFFFPRSHKYPNMAMNSGHRFTGFLQMCKPMRLCVWSCSHHTHIPSCPLQGREHSEEPWPESRPERADAETRQAHWAVPFPPRLLGKTQMA